MAFATLGSLELDGIDSAGVDWSVARDKFSGWDDGAGSTISLVQKPRQSGAWAGSAQEMAMHIAIGGTIRAPSVAAMLDARDRLKSACALYDTVLTITDAGAARWATVRREDEVLFQRLSPTVSAYSIQMVAVDPRKFGDPLTTTTALPSTTGGLTVPFTVPLTINATTVSGQVSLFNPGNATGKVLMRVDGPSHGPVVTHVGSGLSLVFASSLVMGVGEWIDVDNERRTVLANGQSSRSNFVTSRGWSGFEPGWNTWAYTAASFDPEARLTITTAPAWQ